MKKQLATTFTVLSLAPAAIHAASIYVFSSGYVSQDTLVMSTLQAQGHDPFLGMWIADQTDISVITQYDAVYFQPNYTYGFTWPAIQEQQLVDYVNSGGGLVNAEWVLWMQATGRWPVLGNIFPTVATSSFDFAAVANYTKVTADPIINAGLPNTFSVPTQSIAGVRTLATAIKSGATLFYDEGGYKGVVGWNRGNGRVINFNTVNGDAQLLDANFAKLLGNAFRWVTGVVPTGPGVSGHINFLDWVGGSAPATASFRYVSPLNGVVAARVTGTLTSAGNYSIPGPNVPGTYILQAKSGHWLRSSTTVTTSIGNTFSASPMSLTNGDCDGDNEVGPGDFGVLSSSYGTVDGDFYYNPSCDLDGDLEIGPSDFGILSSNYGAAGD